MSETVTVYGSSDDLIEVEGPIREEFYGSDDGEPTYLAFSNGVVVSAQYTNEGVWEVRPTVEPEGVKVGVEFAEGPDSDRYSDVLTFDAEVSWVVAGDRIVRA